MKLYDLNSMLNIDTNYQLKTATYVQDPHERQEKYLKIWRKEMADGPLHNFFKIRVQ